MGLPAEPSKIQGELLKLGYSISRSSIRNVLRRHGAMGFLPPHGV